MIKVIKEKFVVIGKEGSTSDGDGFIQKLWDDADSHFSEIAHLVKREAKGRVSGYKEVYFQFGGIAPFKGYAVFSSKTPERASNPNHYHRRS